jgi:hypothetical protein
MVQSGGTHGPLRRHTKQLRLPVSRSSSATRIRQAQYRWLLEENEAWLLVPT